MATLDSNLVKKKFKHRGRQAGRLEEVTGVIRFDAGESAALTDLLRMVPLGDNVRPVRLILTSVPVSGTPVLTNPTFTAGVTTVSSGTFSRPGSSTTFTNVTADTDILATAITVNADNMASVIEVARPVADSVSNYAPFYVTLTPSGVGAFSVAGGAVDLCLTVQYYGEQADLETAHVYTEYVNQKVQN